jgi:hypothetical protein
MPKNKVYYQGCISLNYRSCFYMDCPEKENCLQFKEFEKKEKERLKNG